MQTVKHMPKEEVALLFLRVSDMLANQMAQHRRELCDLAMENITQEYEVNKTKKTPPDVSRPQCWEKVDVLFLLL